jgi:hypothetical protein
VSFGKLGGTFIDIIERKPVMDAEGFSRMEDTVIASVRAHKEDRHGSKAWANRAAFSTATAMFRFRALPGVIIKPEMSIMCESSRYRILSIENVGGKNMFYDCLAELVIPSKG